MCRSIIGIAILAMLTSCVTSAPPELTGFQPSDQTLAQMLAVSRVKLASVAPGAHIFRVHMENYDRALVFYRTDGPTRHLVVEKVHGEWRVTDAPKKVDTELPEDLIYTWLRGCRGSNQTMQLTASRTAFTLLYD